MSETKNFATYAEQIEKLKSRGCIIDNEERCIDVLSNISYYRLSAYFLPFKKNDNTYIEGTTFTKIYRIYEFDRKLRNLIFSAIEVTEISLRAKLSYFHADKYGALGYLNSDFFNSKHNDIKFKEKIDREIENNIKVPFVQHHLNYYDAQFPLWVISELFTFGMLSYFYNDLTTADKKLFAGRNYNNMVSWFRCCTDLRNICAHYSRLYFRIFTAIPKGIELEENQKRRLWGAINALKELYPDTKKWKNEFVVPLQALIDEYKNDISLNHIAFPTDWYDRLLKEKSSSM